MILFKHLPPLPALTFFEAAARLESFSRAANELCVTQSAVSKQIKTLEDYLSCQLFYRDSQTIRLTSIGREYYLNIAPLLKKIAIQSSHLRNLSTSNEITIISTIAVAHYWLFPRVALFKNLFPHININIYSSDEITAQSCQNYDLGILYGDDNWSGQLHSHHLFHERIYAVCGMHYEVKQKTDSNLASLMSEKLLHLDPQKWRWNNWKEWFGHFDITYSLPPGALIMNNFPLLLQATIANMGVALGWGFAVDELVKNGLIQKASSFYLESTASDYLVYSKQRSLSTAATTFKDWLLEDIHLASLKKLE